VLVREYRHIRMQAWNPPSLLFLRELIACKARASDDPGAAGTIDRK